MRQGLENMLLIGGAYIAKAVQLTTNDAVMNMPMASKTSSRFSSSAWINFAAGNSGAGAQMWGLNLPVNFSSILFGTSDNFNTDVYTLVAAAPNGSFENDSADGAVSMPGGHHVFCAVDISGGSGNALGKIAVDGVVISTTVFHNNLVPTSFALTSSVLLNVLGSNLDTQAAADVWIDFSHYIDPSIPGNLAKFRNPSTGQPVFLGANGQLPLGSPPDYFFTGNATNFVTNQGSAGGTLTVSSGTLTNSPWVPGT